MEDLQLPLRDQSQVESIVLVEPGREYKTPKRRFFICIAGTEVFLAPINMVSGSMASHGEDWKSVFVGYRCPQLR